MAQKIIPGVNPTDMLEAHHVRVFSTREGGSLIHHLEVVRADGEVLLHADGTPVRWNHGRTYGQLLTNAEYMSQKYRFPGSIDRDDIIKQ